MESGERDALCATAEDLYASPIWRVAQYQQIVGAIFGALSICQFLFNANKVPNIFERVPKILIQWMMAMIFTHNIFVTLINSWHQLLYSTRRSPCDLLIVTWKCALLRGPAIACICGMTGVYFLMTLDAIIRVCRPKCYAKSAASLKVSRLVCAFLTLSIAVPLTYIYYGDDFSAERPYCSTSSTRANPRMGLLYMLLFSIDVICTLCLAKILRQSFRELKRNKHGFVVERKVQMRTRIASMRFLIASTFLRCVFVWPFLFGSSLVRLFVPMTNTRLYFGAVGSFYIIQWYGSALALILYNWRPFRIAHRSLALFRASDQTRIHFEHLKKDWR